MGLQACIQRSATLSRTSEFKSVPTIIFEASSISRGVGATAPSDTLAEVQILLSNVMFTAQPTTAISISVLGVILK